MVTKARGVGSKRGSTPTPSAYPSAPNIGQCGPAEVSSICDDLWRCGAGLSAISGGLSAERSSPPELINTYMRALMNSKGLAPEWCCQIECTVNSVIPEGMRLQACAQITNAICTHIPEAKR